MKLHRLSILFLKYFPIMGALFMMIHVGLLLCGYDVEVTKWALISIITVLLVTMSYALEFCWLHRAFIIYAYTVMMCVMWQKSIGFGVILIPMRLGVFVIGGALFGMLFTIKKDRK